MSSRAYAELVARLQRTHLFSTVGDLLGWDEQVNLPPGSADQRAKQLALLAEMGHALSAEARNGELLRELETKPAPADGERVVVRKARRD